MYKLILLNSIKCRYRFILQMHNCTNLILFIIYLLFRHFNIITQTIKIIDVIWNVNLKYFFQYKTSNTFRNFCYLLLKLLWTSVVQRYLLIIYISYSVFFNIVGIQVVLYCGCACLNKMFRNIFVINLISSIQISVKLVIICSNV